MTFKHKALFAVAVLMAIASSGTFMAPSPHINKIDSASLGVSQRPAVVKKVIVNGRQYDLKEYHDEDAKHLEHFDPKGFDQNLVK